LQRSRAATFLQFGSLETYASVAAFQKECHVCWTKVQYPRFSSLAKLKWFYETQTPVRTPDHGPGRPAKYTCESADQSSTRFLSSMMTSRSVKHLDD
jgi:hypothetical protein